MLKKINIRILIFTLILIAITCIVRYFYEFDMLKGVVGCLGGMVITMAKFWMLNKSINSFIVMDKDMAKKKSMLDYGARYIFTGAALVALVLYSFESFVTAAIVLVLGTKAAVYTIKFNDKMKKGGCDGK